MVYRIAIALGTLALMIGSPDAAEFKIYDHGDAEGTCPTLRAIELRGSIEKGDFERLYRLLPSGQASNSGEFVEVGRLSFNSAGGDYLEAVKIAHLLYGYKVQSYVAADAQCTEACAIAFMGGTGIGMEGYLPPDRRFVRGARIRLTMPSFVEVERTEGRSEREVSEQTRDRTLQLFVQILLLAREREWSSTLVRDLVEQGPGHSVDLTDLQVAEDNQVKEGKNCQPYRQWLEE